MVLTAEPTTTQGDIAWAITVLQTGGDTYQRYRRYLAGDQPLTFATEKFRTAFGRLFTEFACNRCKNVVDAHADRLFVEGFGADNETVAQAAQDLWDANHMDVVAGQVMADALAMGDAYVQVQQHTQTGAIQFWPLPADQVRVDYAEDAPNQIARACRRWIDPQQYTRLNLYFPDRIEKYRSRTRTPNSTPASANAFERFQPPGDLGWPLPLPLDDTVPIFHLGNNAPINGYGISELVDVIPLQNALNKTLMDMLVAMEFAAFPQRVVINADLDDPAAVDSIQRVQAGIDRMLTLFSTSKDFPVSFGEFTAANITQYLDVATSWDERIGRVTQVPMHDLIKTGRYPSGASLRMDEAPFTTKIEDRQRAFGYTWADGVVTYGLRLDGTAVQPGDLRVNWKSAAPMAEEDKIALALQKDALGMPFEQSLKELGYEPDQITAILAMKQQAEDQAIQAYSAGNPMGAMTSAGGLLSKSDQGPGRA